MKVQIGEKEALKKSNKQKEVEKILAGYTYNSFSNISANVLERDISTGFTGGNKFVYELLQNADDSSENGKSIHVQFQLITLNDEKYLLFAHDGKHFSRKNLKKIASYADQDNVGDSDEEDDKKADHQEPDISKSKDSEKIGYKGVGFKAVFTIADYAVIFSGGYQFRFDSSSSEQVAWPKNKPYPWQVMPIWTEVDFVPEELRAYMLNDNVNFLFRIVQHADISESIEFVLNNSQMLLFLRKVMRVTLTEQRIAEGKKINIKNEVIHISKNHNGINEITFQNDTPKNSRWLMRSWDYKIELEMKEELKLMSAQACPDRLKKAETIEITFAARVHGENLEAVNNARLYCYLPTQVLAGLPFLVNADFLLDPTRAIMIDNNWNNFLAKLVARCQFTWMSELAQNPQFRLQVLNLLGTSEFKVSSEKCVKEYAREYQHASSSIAFIPGKEPGSSLVLSEALLDETGFYKDFPNLTPTALNKRKLVEPRLSSLDKLKLFNINLLSYEALLPLISQHCYELRSIEEHSKIISFIRSHENHFQLAHLKRAKFILTDNNTIESPDGLCFERQAGCENYPGIDHLRFIHPELLAKLNRNWLESLGVQDATPLKLFRTHVLKVIHDNQITEKNVFQYTRFIFGLFFQNHLTSGDFDKLRKLKVLTRGGGLLEARECYLPDCYYPTLKIETLVPDFPAFISRRYYDSEIPGDYNKKNLERWRDFFSRLGVNSDIEFRSETVMLNEDKKRVWKFDSYLSFLQSRGQATTQVYTSQYILNLVYSPMMHLVEYAAVLPLFWQRLQSQWHIVNNGRSMSYEMSKTSYEIKISYVQFIFSNHPCLRSENLHFLQSTKLFSKKFQILAEYEPAIVAVDANLPLGDEVLQYCGVNYELNFTQCVGLLNKLDRAADVNLSCISVIWRQLLTLEKKLTDYEKRMLGTLNVRFPTQTNDLVEKKKIQLFAIEGRTAPFSPDWIKHYPDFTLEEMKVIAELFGVARFSEKKHELSFGKNEPEKDFNTLDVFFRLISENSKWSIMSILVYLEGRFKGDKKYSAQWKDITERFLKLEFYKVDRITCNYGQQTAAEENLEICLEGSKFYYKRKWKHYKRIVHFSEVLGAYLGLSHQTISTLQNLLFSPDKKLEKEVAKLMLPPTPPFVLSIPELQAEPQEPSVVNSATSKKSSVPAEDKESRGAVLEELSSSDEDYEGEGTSEEDSYELNTPPSSMREKKTPPDTPFSSKQMKGDNKDKRRDKNDAPSLKLVNPAGFDFSQLKRIDYATFSLKKKDLVPPKVSVTLIKEPVSRDNAAGAVNQPPVGMPPSSPAVGLGRPSPAPSGSINKPQLTTQDKNRIGRCGEELIYLRLRNKYLEKYPECTIVDGENGFEISAVKNGEAIKITVIWHNKDAKRDEDRDITIVKPPNKHDEPIVQGQLVQRYIEVKATTTSKQSFNWTAREIALAKAEGNRYKIIRIKNIDSDHPVVAKIRNPVEKLEKELIIEGYKIGF